MAKKVLSIVIGNECTKVCEVSYKKNSKNKSIRVYRSISFLNPANSIEDGFIKDVSLFGEELRKQMKAGRLKSDKVIFSITSSKIANREIILPPTREKKIMDIIKTGSSEYFPIDIKDYILSYLILEKNTSARKLKALQKKLEKKELMLKKQQQKFDRKALKKKSKTEIIAEKMELLDTTSEQLQEPSDISTEGMNDIKKHMRISVFAVPSVLVKNYYSFAKAMHLDIVSLDYSGNSSYQMIKRQANRGTNVFLQLNEKDTLISILRDDTLILQRTVGYGISMLTEAVMEQDYYRTVSKEEALELLASRNLLTGEVEKPEAALLDSSWSQGEAAAAREFLKVTDASNSSDEYKGQEARRYIVDSLHFLTNSVARMLDYYKANHKNEVINKIYISGSGVRIQGIDQFFYQEIGTPHKKMEKLWTVSAKKKATLYRRNPSEFISCIGAVINPIDFAPIELIEKKQKRSAIIATVIFTMACLTASAGTVYVAYTDYLTAKQELNEVNSQLEALPDVSSIYSDNDKAVKEMDNLKEFEETIKNGNDNINAVIDELQKKLPTDAKINTMQFSESGVSMSVTAIESNVGANALIAKLYTQLETIEYFDTVDITDIAIEDGEVTSEVSFTITCTYVK